MTDTNSNEEKIENARNSEERIESTPLDKKRKREEESTEEKTDKKEGQFEENENSKESSEDSKESSEDSEDEKEKKAKKQKRAPIPSNPEEDLEYVRNSDNFAIIFHFFSIFRGSYGIKTLTIEDLEQALTIPNDNGLFTEIIVKLLRGISKKKPGSIIITNWEKSLQEFVDLLVYEDELLEENPLSDSNFWDLPIEDRIYIIRELCESQVQENETIRTKIKDDEKNNDLSKYRLEKLGTDSKNNVYYYFNDSRLYRESSPKGNHKGGQWELICSNLEEWEEFCNNLSKSRNSNDKKLYAIVGKEIFPSISAKIQSKKRAEKRKQMYELAPRKRSTRIQEREQKKLEGQRLEEQKRLNRRALQYTIESQDRSIVRTRLQKKQEDIGLQNLTSLENEIPEITNNHNSGSNQNTTPINDENMNNGNTIHVVNETSNNTIEQNGNPLTNLSQT